MLAKNPTDLVAKVKDLSISDFSLMSFLSFELKKRISSYFTIDAFTVSDPFPTKDDLNYLIVVDNSNNNRIVAFIAIKDNVDISVLDSLLGNELSRLELPRSTSPSLGTAPLANIIPSPSVVLPEPIWPTRHTFLMSFASYCFIEYLLEFG